MRRLNFITKSILTAFLTLAFVPLLGDELEAADLTVTFAGNGSGTVNSIPSGAIACPGDCSEVYASGTEVTLAATTSGPSTFVGWSGGNCSGTGNCVFTITANADVIATFNQIPMVKVGLDFYATIQAAYDAALSMGGSTLWARDQTFAEDLLFDEEKNVTFIGGYNATWDEPVAGNTIINGILTIVGARGSVTISNLIIE